ncbi:MAG: DUF4878 domain-containing protein [Pyrinomonadaceae bacterium]|nr:DUF4878 domain-containing protein [Pyrinomonadaceae bacterium]
MNNFKLVFIAVLALIISACGGSAEPETPANANAARAENRAPVEPEKEKPEPEVSYPRESYSQKTPTDAYKTYIMATVNGDAETVKKLLSKASLEFVEKSAKEQGRTVDELLTGGAVQNESKKIPEVRNEKIDGKNATIEFKDESMPEYLKMPLVKENGEWKVALDKFMQELLQQLQNDLQKV